ncbi:hypothetical protein [Rhodoferax sediminis]|uniref:Uncharacterized protein n=1 Tax=Rhodoferax sediminis TaxID=2509614 RepID=A0A515DA06_9BURK|nr:hypothetical protein [Rhodoferax sediminis]QDL37242.1 hypothetical protein EUB48_08075 [Rhodoferax sediminis]
MSALNDLLDSEDLQFGSSVVEESALVWPTAKACNEFKAAGQSEAKDPRAKQFRWIAATTRIIFLPLGGC